MTKAGRAMACWAVVVVLAACTSGNASPGDDVAPTTTASSTTPTTVQPTTTSWCPTEVATEAVALEAVEAGCPQPTVSTTTTVRLPPPTTIPPSPPPEALRCGAHGIVEGCYPADDPIWDIEDEMLRREMEEQLTTPSTTFDAWHRETYGCEWYEGYLC